MQNLQPQPPQINFLPLPNTTAHLVTKYIILEDEDGLSLEYFLGATNEGEFFWWAAARYWTGEARFCKLELTPAETENLKKYNITVFNPEDKLGVGIENGKDSDYTGRLFGFKTHKEWDEAETNAAIERAAEAELAVKTWGIYY